MGDMIYALEIMFLMNVKTGTLPSSLESGLIFKSFTGCLEIALKLWPRHIPLERNP